MKKIYLDYAATTPVDKGVQKAMNPYFSEKFGNASSLHSFGREAKDILEKSRKTIAKFINAYSSEIFFTSSATESNNLALQGIAMAARDTGKHIIISSLEHASVLETAKWLQKWGFKITELPVNNYGEVNLEVLKNSITDKTILVSVTHASNEIGTIEPITEIGKICREKGVYFHTDAVQSFGKLPIDVKKMDIDLLTASAHKIYGPKGVALLYVRKGITIEPMLQGGGQENGLRGSTVNVPAVAGFAKATEICKSQMQKENKRLENLRDKLINEVLKINGARLNGHPQKRLSNILNFWFENIDGELLVTHLDLKGFACSTGAACASSEAKLSHVLTAIGLNKKQAQGSLRISLGRQTIEKEISEFIKILPKIIKQMRQNLSN